MAACEICGSLKTRVVDGTFGQRILALVLRQEIRACPRCGVTARMRRAADAQTGELSPSSRRRRIVSETAGPAVARHEVDLNALDRSLSAEQPLDQADDAGLPDDGDAAPRPSRRRLLRRRIPAGVAAHSSPRR